MPIPPDLFSNNEGGRRAYQVVLLQYIAGLLEQLLARTPEPTETEAEWERPTDWGDF